ncbi:MAG: hypothetical protein M3Q65_19255 [Chloroflexota bacterium]|nr:hypothetical protein [Chloroflexota bacterium]
MAMKRAASRSDAQQEAGRAAIARYGALQGVALEPRRLTLRGVALQVDGYAEADGRVVLAEVWAHIGPAKGAQRHRVLADVLKLALVSKILREERPGYRIDCAFVLLNEEAAGILRGQGWPAAAAEEFDIQVAVVPIDQDLVEAVRAAQVRQDLRNDE